MILDQDYRVIEGVGLVLRGGWGSRINSCSWCIMESSNTRKDGVAVCTGYLPSKHIQFNSIEFHTTQSFGESQLILGSFLMLACQSQDIISH